MSQRILFRWLGFREEVTIPLPGKYILALAPHTSNWDFVLGRLYSNAVGLKCNFLMKKEWFFWPLGPIFRKLGGIPVWRSKHNSMTDNLAQTALQRQTFQLCITPEGTRARTTEWKKGFYYIAMKAGIPILLYGIDYRDKLISCTKTIVPDGNIEAQMREIKEYYKDFIGKKPQNFTTGE